MRCAILAVLTLSVVGMASKSHAAPIYGATDTNIVRIDPANPSDTSVVGSHNLPGELGVRNLAFDRDGNRMFGLVQDNSQPNQSQDQFIYEFDIDTGDATRQLDLGNEQADDGGNFYESLTYVDARGSLVTAHGSGFGPVTPQIQELDLTAGTTSDLVNNGEDNGHMAYDPNAGVLYTSDNGGLATTDLSTGSYTGLGSLASKVNDVTAMPETGQVFTIDQTSNHLIRADINLQNESLTTTDLGVIGVDGAEALTTAAPVPEPGTALLLAFGGVGLAGRRRRRSRA